MEKPGRKGKGEAVVKNSFLSFFPSIFFLHLYRQKAHPREEKKKKKVGNRAQTRERQQRGAQTRLPGERGRRSAVARSGSGAAGAERPLALLSGAMGPG